LASVVLALVGGPVASVALGAGTTPAVPLPTTSSNPLSPGLPVSPAPSTTSATPTVIQNSSANTSGGSTLSSGSALFIAIGAVVVLGGIAFFIWRDARRRAPERGGEGYEIRRSGSKRPPKQRKLSPAERKRRKRGRAKR
jgi:hypothetical protein